MQEDLLNQVKLNFSPESLIVLNIILGFVMFGVALELKLQHFKELVRAPKTYLIGLSAQFILLPAITFLLILLLDPLPGIALGMILVFLPVPVAIYLISFLHWPKQIWLYL